jgi:predicted amidohydrolase
MVVSPWGEIQAELEQAPGLLIADVNTEIVDEVRQAMPVAHHIRFEQNLSFK